VWTGTSVAAFVRPEAEMLVGKCEGRGRGDVRGRGEGRGRGKGELVIGAEGGAV